MAVDGLDARVHFPARKDVADVLNALDAAAGARPVPSAPMSHRPADGRQIEGGERVLIPTLCGNVPAASATC